MMMRKSPSGALSPYYYKGGYFHSIYYGSYFNDTAALLSMMAEEEAFILCSADRRRILIDLYETNVDAVLDEFTSHIDRLSTNGKIIKLAISADKKTLKTIRNALFAGCSLLKGCMYFSPDMEESKTWLVSDHY
jgi:hypothetical protein